MTEVVRFRLDDGSPVLFEVEEDASGIARVGRGGDGVVDATRRLEEALESARHAAMTSVQAFRGLLPEKIELEFGVKLTAEAGALIAKTVADGHFVVKLSWERTDASPGLNET